MKKYLTVCVCALIVGALLPVPAATTQPTTQVSITTTVTDAAGKVLATLNQQVTLLASTQPATTQAAAAIVITAPASATPNPAIGTPDLSVLSCSATENGSAAGLTYTWSYETLAPAITYSGAANGSAAANHITAHFTVGVHANYVFTCTVQDTAGHTATSQVTVVKG